MPGNRPDPPAASMQERWLTYRLRRWADAREKRNPFGHGKTGTALLREAAERIEELEALIPANRGGSRMDTWSDVG